MQLKTAIKNVSAICFTLILGCAGKPVIHEYDEMKLKRIIRASHKKIVLDCTNVNGAWDDGTPRPRWSNVIGCSWLHEDGSCVIEIENSCRGAKALPHELAHCAGVKDPDNEGYDWTEP